MGGPMFSLVSISLDHPVDSLVIEPSLPCHYFSDATHQQIGRYRASENATHTPPQVVHGFFFPGVMRNDDDLCAMLRSPDYFRNSIRWIRRQPRLEKDDVGRGVRYHIQRLLQTVGLGDDFQIFLEGENLGHSHPENRLRIGNDNIHRASPRFRHAWLRLAPTKRRLPLGFLVSRQNSFRASRTGIHR